MRSKATRQDDDSKHRHKHKYYADFVHLLLSSTRSSSQAMSNTSSSDFRLSPVTTGMVVYLF